MNKNAHLRSCILGVTSFLLLLAVMPALAQLPSGTILGVVKDSSGGVVAGATVTITNNETRLTRTATTGQDGSYRLNALPVGHYNLRAEQAGFKSESQQGLTLEVSQEAVVNFTLQVGSATQEVVVSAASPLVNTTNSALGGLVNEAKMSELPLNGRNYVELSLLQPGVAQATSVAQTSVGKGGTVYSSDGAPLRSNNYLLDGAQLQNLIGFTAASAAGTTLGVDGIREYKVVTSNFSAEYGMTMGSQTVMVSRGGTNQFHGNVFEFLRNGAMDARSPVDFTYQKTGDREPQYQRNNFGGSFGGPIRRDKTFFYAVYEGLREHKGIPTLITVPAVGCHGAAGAMITTAACPQLGANPVTIASAAAPLLALYPIPNTGATGYSYAPLQPTSVNYGQIRVDHSFSTADSAFVRYTLDDGYQLRPLSYPQFTEPWSSRDQYLTLSENHIFSTSLLNTGRFSFSRTAYNSATLAPASLFASDVAMVPGSYTGFLVVPTLTQFQPGATDPAMDTQNLLTLSDDVLYTKGKHALKFGTLMNHFQLPVTAGSNHAGTITSSSLAAFMSGIATSYLGLIPGSNINHMWQYFTFGFYAQDDWRLTQRLTLNLGLRYEFNTSIVDEQGRQAAVQDWATQGPAATPGPVIRNASLKNFSPRVGFAWDVFGSGKTSLRAGFGEYYDISTVGATITNSIGSIYPYAASETVLPPTGQTSVAYTVPLSFPAPNPSTLALQIVDYQSTQPHLLQWNVSVDQQLPANVGLTVSYVGTRGIDLYGLQEGNPCIPTSVTNGIPYWATPCGQGRRNVSWGSVALTTTANDSWYEGLQVGLNKRLSHGLELQSSYTYSKTLDDTEAQIGSDGTGVRLYAATGGGALDKGPSTFDMTHNWRLNILDHLPNIKSDNWAAKLLNGWWTGNIFTLQTGYAFSPTEGTLRNDSLSATAVPASNNPDRPNIVTADNVAAIRSCTYTYMGLPGGCNPNAVPFDASTAITGNPMQWFNPNMFILQPAGFPGDAGRGILRGPGLVNWNFALNKDTKLPFLGENGSLQFRAEMFNILNHANWALPSTTVFSGTIKDVTESAASSAGLINAINPGTSPRDIQLGLKLIF